MKKIKLILSVLFGMIFVFLITSCGEKPHVHNLVEHERKEATCEEDGYEAYVECTDCDYTTYKVIKAKGHDFDSNYLYNATKHYHKCKKCDAIKDENSHTFAWIIDKFATEDEIGIKHEKCNVCEYTRNENTIIDKLAHTHNMLHVVKVDKTCTSDGNIEYYHCSKCEKNYLDKNGDNEVVDVVIKASHEYGDYHEEINATCSKEGTKGHYECSECHNYFDANKNKLNSLIIEKKPHDYKWVIDKPATEEEFGLKHEECNVCHYTRNENTIIVKLNHTHNMEHVLRIDKTCTSDGNIEYYHCNKCNKNYLDVNGNNEVVDVVIKASHEYGNFINEVASTCTSEGIKGHYECSVCHSYFDANKNKLDSLVIAKKNHDYKTIYSYNESKHYYECKNCNAKKDEENHNFTWIVDKEATEEETGLKHEECNVCHYTRNENTVIDKANHIHNMEHVLKVDKTCTRNGNIEYYHCVKCNKNYLDINGNNEVVDVVIKASHEYGSFINEVDSTCTSEGTKGHYECSICHNYFDANKNKLDSLVIAMKAHVYKNEWSHDENTHYHECKVCNTKKEISRHNYITNYEGYDKCSVCDYEDKICKVYFDVDGGEQINTQKYEYKTIISLPIPKKNGYDFVGWEYNDRLYNKIEVNKNITLKAIWIKNFEYSLSDDGTIIIYKYTGNDKTIEFPKHKVVIENYAFSYCSSLTSIEIPSSVTSIGDSAFSGCSNLKEVKILDGCTSIGHGAFSGCSSLASITIPNSVTSIGDSAFSGCSSLASITISNSLTTIENSTFEDCSSLTSIEIPNSVTSIRDNAFYNCSSLTNIIIPSSVTNIGNWTFHNCNSLTNIDLPNSITSIGEYSFKDCTNLTNIGIPNSVTSIGDYAFYNCSSLTNIIIPSSVTNMGNWTFYNCSNLTSINLPTNITSIGNCAFYNCISLTNIIIPSSVICIESRAFSNCTSLLNIEIPSGVTSIETCAFEDCRNLTSILISSSVTNIGKFAFQRCINLSSISVDSNNKVYDSRNNCNAIIETTENRLILGCKSTKIPADVTNIGEYAFSYCGSLTSIEIPTSVTCIESKAFSNCTSLLNIEIPVSVTSIGVCAFENCNSLRSIVLPFVGSNDGFPAYRFGYIFGEPSIFNYNSYVPKSLKEVKILEGCTSISTNTGAFEGCRYLESIELPSTIKSISKCVFEYCDSLINLTLPYIGGEYNWQKAMPLCYMFSGEQDSNYNEFIPKTLKKVTILEGCDSICEKAFSGCDSLTNIVIPSSVKEIGKCAFDNCNSLVEISLPFIGENKNVCKPICYMFTGSQDSSDNKYLPKTLKKITILEGCKTIGGSTFNNCTDLVSVVIPSSVISIGSSAFIGCASLTNIEISPNNKFYDSRDNCNAVIETSTNTLICGCKKTVIPNGVTSIGDYAFKDCYYIENIEIPSSVISIGIGAFLNCTNLKSVTISEGCTTIKVSAFGECSSLGKIVIPSSIVTIEAGTFYNCKNLINMELPNTIISIEADVFSGCSNLTSIVIPDSVLSIGERAFSGCSSLTTIEIPSNVTTIEGNAFYNCSSLASIVIPLSVTKIDSGAFKNCKKLIIYCEASSQPSNWNKKWNISNCKTIWNYQGKENKI